jgi:hypothetical protein
MELLFKVVRWRSRLMDHHLSGLIHWGCYRSPWDAEHSSSLGVRHGRPTGYPGSGSRARQPQDAHIS